MEFSRQTTGVGSHSLLQGIFLTQGSNLHPLHCSQILHYLIKNTGKPNVCKAIAKQKEPQVHCSITIPPTTGGCFQLSESSLDVFLWPDPLLPCIFCSLNLTQTLIISIASCLSPPLPLYQRWQLTLDGSTPSKAQVQEPLVLPAASGSSPFNQDVSTAYAKI